MATKSSFGLDHSIRCARIATTPISSVSSMEAEPASPLALMDGRSGKLKYDCHCCGASFIARPDRTKYCSRECALALRRHLASTKAVKFSVLRKPCIECSGMFSASARALICSDACRKAKARRSARALAVAAYVPARFECIECESVFETSYGATRAVFCSDECGCRNTRRTARKKERARLRGCLVEAVDPIKVFERDGWRCHLCGRKTPRRLRGTTDGAAPELDHIIPLSRSGAYSYVNTACACRRCNGEKSNNIRGQLLMFG
jgi:5-methylcytosine-specific restriction endonuclease McrA